MANAAATDGRMGRAVTVVCGGVPVGVVVGIVVGSVPFVVERQRVSG
jgi:hypothetical protein